jgi:hypothetical protein
MAEAAILGENLKYYSKRVSWIIVIFFSQSLFWETYITL